MGIGLSRREGAALSMSERMNLCSRGQGTFSSGSSGLMDTVVLGE